MKTIKFFCPVCNQKIEAPKSMACESMICPTCKAGFILQIRPKSIAIHNRVWFTIFAIIALLFILNICFQNKSDNSVAVAHVEPSPYDKLLAEIQSSDSKPIAEVAPFNGLFGIAIGEKIPKECRVKFTFESEGVIVAHIIPAITNSEFKDYAVDIDPDTKRIFSITGQSRDAVPLAESEATRVRLEGIFENLNARYGKPDETSFLGGKWLSNHWKKGNRRIALGRSIENEVELTCTDTKIQESVKFKWELTQKAKAESKGL